MGDAAVPWGTGPVYRPPDARPEWEEPVQRPLATVTPFRRGTLRIDAARAEDVLEDVTVAQARRALALRRRLNRATAQATRAVEQRQRPAPRVERSTAGELERLEREREAAMAELVAVRRAAEDRLRQRAEAEDAARQAAADAARAAEDAARRAEEHARAEVARAARARLAAEKADHERRTARELARREAERVEQARLAALELARAEDQVREAAWIERRTEGRQRLALANKLEQSAAFLREYEEWARSRGLRDTSEEAGLTLEADRLGRRVDELRYG